MSSTEEENVYHIRMAFGEEGTTPEPAIILTVEFENCDILTAANKKGFAMGIFQLVIDEAS